MMWAFQPCFLVAIVMRMTGMLRCVFHSTEALIFYTPPLKKSEQKFVLVIKASVEKPLVMR